MSFYRASRSATRFAHAARAPGGNLCKRACQISCAAAVPEQFGLTLALRSTWLAFGAHGAMRSKKWNESVERSSCSAWPKHVRLKFGVLPNGVRTFHASKHTMHRRISAEAHG